MLIRKCWKIKFGFNIEYGSDGFALTLTYSDCALGSLEAHAASIFRVKVRRERVHFIYIGSKQDTHKGKGGGCLVQTSRDNGPGISPYPSSPSASWIKIYIYLNPEGECMYPSDVGYTPRIYSVEPQEQKHLKSTRGRPNLISNDTYFCSILKWLQKYSLKALISAML